MTGQGKIYKFKINHTAQKGENYGIKKFSGFHPSRRRVLRAQDMIEFALIFPVLVFFAVGILDVGRVFHVLIAISNAAREGVRQGVIYGIAREGGAYSIGDPDVMINAAIQEAGNFNLQLAAGDVSSACVCYSSDLAICPTTDTCTAGETLRVIVTYTLQPITTVLLDSDIIITRDMEMMIP